MLKKWIILASIALAAHAGTIQRRTIPVEVRYDEDPKVSVSATENKVQIQNEVITPTADKVELSLEGSKAEVNLQKEPLSDERPSTAAPLITEAEKEIIRPNPEKNLEEKVQLSENELPEALKHLPTETNVLANDLIIHPTEELALFARLGEVKSDESCLTLVQKAHDIVVQGIKSIREKSLILKTTEKQPTEEQWNDLEKSLNNYFEEEKTKAVGLRQENQGGIFQNIINNVQNLTGNFIQNVQNQFSGANNNNNVNGTQNEEQPGILGQFVNNFNNGIQNIQSSISNVFNQQQPTTSNTNLSDSPTTQSSNLFSNFVNNVQQFFTGNQGNTVGSNGTQSDEVTGTTASPGGPLQIISNVQGTIGNAINNFVQTIQPTTRAPGNLSDETTATPAVGPFVAIQQVGSQIGSAINNFITGGSSRPPTSSGDDPSTQAPPQNIIQSIGQNVGDAFQNFISGGQNAIQQVSGGVSGSNNPIVSGAQQIGQQISQAVTGNPLQQIGQQISQAVTGNPLQQIGQQISQAVTGNPIQAIQGAISGGGSRNSTETPTQPPAKDIPDVSEEPATSIKDTEKKEEIMITAE